MWLSNQRLQLKSPMSERPGKPIRSYPSLGFFAASQMISNDLNSFTLLYSNKSIYIYILTFSNIDAENPWQSMTIHPYFYMSGFPHRFSTSFHQGPGVGWPFSNQRSSNDPWGGSGRSSQITMEHPWISIEKMMIEKYRIRIYIYTVYIYIYYIFFSI